MQTLESHQPQMPVGQISVPVYEPPEVMTARQAARFLQVDEPTVLKLADEGKLPGRKLGDEWRFSRAALLDWLAGQDA